MTALLAAACAAGALLLGLHRSRPVRPAGRRRWAPALVMAVFVAAVLGWVTESLFAAKGLALGVIAAGAAGAVVQIVRRDRARSRAAALRRDVVEICESLAGDVRGGSPPVLALARAAEQWPLLSEVAKAAELGGDVPSSLRQLARRSGAESLSATAAAWQVSLVTGSGLAGALERCAESARTDLSTADLVAGELATARATARLLTLLPVVVLMLGRGMGIDPWGFLLTTWPGISCLAGGIALAWAGLQWVDRIGERAER